MLNEYALIRIKDRYIAAQRSVNNLKRVRIIADFSERLSNAKRCSLSNSTEIESGRRCHTFHWRATRCITDEPNLIIINSFRIRYNSINKHLYIPYSSYSPYRLLLDHNGSERLHNPYRTDSLGIEMFD